MVSARSVALCAVAAMSVLACVGTKNPMLQEHTFWAGEGFELVDRVRAPHFVTTWSSFGTLDGQHGFTIKPPAYGVGRFLSADGRWLAIRHNDVLKVVMYDFDSGKTTDIPCNGNAFAGAWTEDGRFLFASVPSALTGKLDRDDKARGIFAWGRDGDIRPVHVFDPGTRVGLRGFSAGPKAELAFLFDPDILQGDTAALWVMNPDVPASARKVAERAMDPSWSPDGSQLVYSSVTIDKNGCQGHGLRVVAADGTGDRAVTDFGVLPAWSPNGEWIAFVSGDREVWMVRPNGSETRRIVGFGDGTAGRGSFRPCSRREEGMDPPTWSPDSRYLAAEVFTPGSGKKWLDIPTIVGGIPGGAMGFVADLQERKVMASRFHGNLEITGTIVKFVPATARERLLAYSKRSPASIDWSEDFGLPWQRRIWE